MPNTPNELYTNEELDTGLRKVGPNTYEQILDESNKPLAWRKDTRPPGAKPSDEQLGQFEERMKFANYVRDQIGYNPKVNILEEARKRADEDMGKINRLFPIYGLQTKHEIEEYGRILKSHLEFGQKEIAGKRNEFESIMRMYDTEAATTGKRPADPTTTERPFSSWDDSTKETSFQEKILTGKDARFSNRDAESTRLWREEYNKYLNAKGLTQEQVNAIQSEASSYKKSIDFQQKNRDMMNSFVKNIDKQIDKVEDLMAGGDIQRFGFRAADMGVRELKTRLVGSGAERVLESYLREVSNEIAKVVTGSQASIQEVSVEAQKVWSQIHDKNLSFPEIKKVLDATRKQGELRLQSTDEAIAESRAKQLQILTKYLNKGTQPTPQDGKRDASALSQYIATNSNKYPQKALYDKMKASGWTDDEIKAAWRAYRGR